MSRSILKNRSFWPLFLTQFLGAFNDNFFRIVLVTLITFRATSILGLSPEQLVAACAAIFIFPFFPLSATAGQISDKFERSKIIRFTKIWEIIVMSLGAYGFISGNIAFLLLVLFFMGLQSTFFGPPKYSYLPQVFKEGDLVAANSFFQTGTFLAIFLGAILGGIVIALESNAAYWASVSVISIAILGYIFSRFVLPVRIGDPKLSINKEPIKPTIAVIKRAYKNKVAFLSILGISWFWFFGSSMLSLLPPMVKNILGGNEHVLNFFLALFFIGIGVGSMLCKLFSGKILELGLTPFGSIGLSLFSFSLFYVADPIAPATTAISLGEFLQSSHGWKISLNLLLLSVFAGFYIIPLNTLLQSSCKKEEVSRFISCNNILNAIAMVIGSIFLSLLYSLDFSIPEIFLVLSILNLAVATYIYTVIPEFFLRFLAWILSKLMYKFQVKNAHNFPLQGPALLVCNHVTYVDWLFIASACRRPVRFVMDYKYFKLPLVAFVFRGGKVIPIAKAKENKEIMDRAFEKVKEELRAGNIVCIFPEGRLTKDGEMDIFRPGIERLVEETPVKVIPMALSGLWKSLFSLNPESILKRFPGKLFRKVTLTVGIPIAPEKVKAEKLFEEVKKLRHVI